MGVARFFASGAGRWLRGLVGAVFVVWAILLHSIWLGALGLLFVIVGVGNVCALAPLCGGPFNGRNVGPDAGPDVPTAQ